MTYNSHGDTLHLADDTMTTYLFIRLSALIKYHELLAQTMSQPKWQKGMNPTASWSNMKQTRGDPWVGEQIILVLFVRESC